MKVKELIKHLESYDPEAPVVVEGYEGGFDDVEVLDPVHILIQSGRRISAIWPVILMNLAGQDDLPARLK
jgi:hypothetical protein